MEEQKIHKSTNEELCHLEHINHVKCVIFFEYVPFVYLLLLVQVTAFLL